VSPRARNATYLSAFKYATLFYKMSKQMHLYYLNSSQKRLSHKSDPFVTGSLLVLIYFEINGEFLENMENTLSQAVCRWVVGVIKPSKVLDVNRVIFHSSFPLQDTHSTSL
jgi:hypothetical protein